MKTILVPVDFSAASNNACNYASEFALAGGFKILLMHTYETPVLFSEIPLTTFQADMAIMHDIGMNGLKKLATKLQKKYPKVKYEISLQQGLPSSRITEMALEKKVSMVIMGTTGKGYLERAVLGSNAIRVIRNAPCLVMAIPPKATFRKLKKIAYATDLAEQNIKHVSPLLSLLKLFNSKLMLVYINTDLSQFDSIDANQKAKQMIERSVKYKNKSVIVIDNMSVADGIQEFIKQNKPDCISIFCHHRSILQEVYDPGITKKISLHTSIPLLVVHESDFLIKRIN